MALKHYFCKFAPTKQMNMIKRRNITPKHPWHDCNGLALHFIWQRQRAVSVYFIGGHPNERMD